MIGIYGISSQSGLAYFADFLSLGKSIIGYARSSINGRNCISEIKNKKGINLFRPENENKENSKFLSLNDSELTNDLNEFVKKSTIIIICVPSIYHEKVVDDLFHAGLNKKRIPIILSPSRTFASPYLWKILGDRYPIVCFSTCPYSCKIINYNTSYIKRRKRTWVASYEGDFFTHDINYLSELFPQVTFTKTPAFTSLNNIGAIFHCATYLLNKNNIEESEKINSTFSFYIDGIANNPNVGEVIYNIDQIRLEIAYKLGLDTFGFHKKPREDIWRKITNSLRALEEESKEDIQILRKIRGQFLEYINNCVISVQHWLDITYGVIRNPCESISQTIGRTPTYQKNSIPQIRYVDEDIPTGLVPLEALAKTLNIECEIITDLIDKYNAEYSINVRDVGRNLKIFKKDYIIDYLLGNNF